MTVANPGSISGINQLPHAEQLQTFGALIPDKIVNRYKINRTHYVDEHDQPLLELRASPGATAVEIFLRHEYGARDPLMYFHLADTQNNRIVVLLAVVNDPAAPRFDVDVMPDGSKTNFGVFKRNTPAETTAMEAGLAPGQVKRGLRVLRDVLAGFEQFIGARGHDLYYLEPLFYHNAIIFERYGFAYQQGKRFMESLHTRFADPRSPLVARLDSSSPFRRPGAERSIRWRSWAIHDGILGEPFTGVHMYKRVGEVAGVVTFPDGVW